MSLTKIIRGKPESFVFDYDIDITGYTIIDIIKHNKSDSDAEAIFTKMVTVHTDPENGVSGYTMTASQTDGIENGTYWHATKLFDSGGDPVSETEPDQLQFVQNLVQSLSV